MDRNQEMQELMHSNLTLAARLAQKENELEEVRMQLRRIKEHPFWKLSAPLRKLMHFFLRNLRRVRNLGGPRGIYRKLQCKKIERQARALHGTASFPSPEERIAQESRIFTKEICFSILVPLYNTPVSFLRDMIESVQEQTYQRWQLCLADGSTSDHPEVEEICKEYAREDERICYQRLAKNEGISGNTNAALAMATGEYIALFDHDDILHPCALYEYMVAICERGADYLYCDETTFRGDSIDHMLTLHFKPDFAPDNLRANNYICHFSAFARELLADMPLFRPEYDGSQDHDMILRLTDKANCIVHVPKLLYYWRSHKGSVAAGISAKTYAIEAAKGAVASHLRSKGFRDFTISGTRAFETIFRIQYALDEFPLLSILIPNMDHVEDLRRCITSIIEKSTYPSYEIIVIENNSVQEATFRYYDSLREDERIRIVTWEGPFHYAAINNYGATFARGEYLILLNNDTSVITMNWMEELLMYAQRQDVGAVGCKLYYPNQTIQHAGVVLGLGAHCVAGHSHYGVHKDNLGYMGRLCYAQNVMAVTGACMMVSRKKYMQMEGLDEDFAISLNDVDFCVRLHEAGYLNVFTPFAELYHYESISRGLDDKDDKLERYNKEADLFRSRWKTILDQGDPYYNINFSLDRSDFALRV